MRPLYLGVDAGNSKTVALVATADGTVLGWGRAGIGDIYGGYGAERAADEVCAAAGQALRMAGAAPGDVRRAAFRLAGVDWPEDEAFWHGTIGARLGGIGSWSVKNDGFALLPYAGPSRTGVSVVVGTGAAIAARGARGDEFSPSFWIREPLGAVALGFAGFQYVMRAHLGLEPPTTMTAGFLELFGEPEVPELLKSFTRYEAPRPHNALGRASRTVLRLAASGDRAAHRIVQEQAAAVAAYASVAARWVGFDLDEAPIAVVLGGSVLASEHHVFREASIEAIRMRLPHAWLTDEPGPPVEGALLDALAEDGLHLGADVRARVAAPTYPVDLLQT
ncbi:BadF/BadG/BcrA/BcrD ATPase family protein [Amnibacterium sp. CER49]|uniref:BadF/BadG/BcrA/BcrD ATPase family protein n=1 Tax=Amnibacterium sp. CER49 TaxID=3039161 RepID=UPI0024472C2C|nr:BadF/BadG/BcrA/BcrD ATPase family protein [Amnibacterium sp. CER49]MDH2443210.1 BadF/BadG/BcrA/BcrD ATPase family protein [Amnibacterium sp. CER49]